MAAVPLPPAVKVSPVVPPRVSVPLVTERVACAVPAESGSLIEIGLPPALEKTRLVFSLSEPLAGAVIVGVAVHKPE